MTLDHTADLLRLSQDYMEDLLRLSVMQVQLREIRARLVKGISKTGNRSLAANVNMNLLAANDRIQWATDNIQPKRRDDSGIPEREALQL